MSDGVHPLSVLPQGLTAASPEKKPWLQAPHDLWYIILHRDCSVSIPTSPPRHRRRCGRPHALFLSATEHLQRECRWSSAISVLPDRALYITSVSFLRRGVFLPSCTASPRDAGPNWDFSDRYFSISPVCVYLFWLFFCNLVVTGSDFFGIQPKKPRCFPQRNC